MKAHKYQAEKKLVAVVAITVKVTNIFYYILYRKNTSIYIIYTAYTYYKKYRSFLFCMFSVLTLCIVHMKRGENFKCGKVELASR